MRLPKITEKDIFGPYKPEDFYDEEILAPKKEPEFGVNTGRKTHSYSKNAWHYEQKSFFERLFDALTGGFAKLTYIALIVVTLVALILPVYRINLIVNVDDGFKVHYLAGAIWIEKDGVLSQYKNRQGTYSLDYLTSVFQPHIKIDNTVLAIYRMYAERVRIGDDIWYYYVNEDGVFLADDISRIPEYEKALIATKTKSVYPSRQTLLTTEWSEIYQSYTQNIIQGSLNCNTEEISQCQNIFDAYETQVVDDPVYDNSFIATFSFIYNSRFSLDNVLSYNAFIVPDTYDVCMNSKSCINTDTVVWNQQPDFPVWVRTAEGNQDKTVKDFDFNNFQKSTLFLPDRLSQDSPAGNPLPAQPTYYFKHRGNGETISLTPLTRTPSVDYMPKFRQIRFGTDDCTLNVCTLAVRITVDNSKVPDPVIS